MNVRFNWIMPLLGFTILIDVTSSADLPDLVTIDSAHKANRELAKSGYCEIRTTDIRSKDNLLAASKVPMGIRLQRLPIVAATQDARLGGRCWFKWQGDKYASLDRRYVSGYDKKTEAPYLLVSENFDTYDGSVHRAMTKRYSTPIDLLKAGDIPMVENAELKSVRGSIDHEMPTLGNAPSSIGELGYFSPPLYGPVPYYESYCAAPVRLEDGNLEVTQTHSGARYTLDPLKSFMPIATRSGVEGTNWRQRDLQYEQTKEGAWFPVNVVSKTFEEGKSRIHRILEVTKYEMNKTYPDSDFDLVFPAGTKVDDDVRGGRYIVGGSPLGEDTILEPVLRTLYECDSDVGTDQPDLRNVQGHPNLPNPSVPKSLFGPTK